MGKKDESDNVEKSHIDYREYKDVESHVKLEVSSSSNNSQTTKEGNAKQRLGSKEIPH